MAVATGALSAAVRSYPMSEVGAEAVRTPCPKGGGQEELPHVRGQEQRPRVPGCDGAGTAERSYPASKVRGSGREELPHTPKPEGIDISYSGIEPRSPALAGRFFTI